MLAIVAFAALAALARAELAATDVKIIQDFFTNGLLNPLFPGNFTTQGLVQAKWPNNATLALGGALDPGLAKNYTGDMSLNPAPGATAFKPENLYTAVLIDAGTTNTTIKEGEANQKLHWLINNIHLNQTTAGGPYAFNVMNGTTVKQYEGPNPPATDGPHRYVFLVYNQPANFTPPAAYSNQSQIANVADFDFVKYASDAKLTEVAGATYFTVQNGNSTNGVVPTSTTNGNITAPTNGATGNGGNGTGNGGNGGSATSSGASASESAPSGSSTAKSSAFRSLPAVGFTVLAAAAAALL